MKLLHTAGISCLLVLTVFLIFSPLLIVGLGLLVIGGASWYAKKRITGVTKSVYTGIAYGTIVSLVFSVAFLAYMLVSDADLMGLIVVLPFAGMIILVGACSGWVMGLIKRKKTR